MSRILSRRSERILQKQAKQGGQVKKKFDSTLIEYGRVSAGDFFLLLKSSSFPSECATKVALDIEAIMHTQRAMKI